MGIVRRAQGARRKAVSGYTVDDEQRSDRPQDPCALRVAAARARLLRCLASTMRTNIACGSAPCIRARGARNAALCTFTTGCYATDHVHRRLPARSVLTAAVAARSSD